jgi:hypothetical protein
VTLHAGVFPVRRDPYVCHVAPESPARYNWGSVLSAISSDGTLRPNPAAFKAAVARALSVVGRDCWGRALPGPSSGDFEL